MPKKKPAIDTTVKGKKRPMKLAPPKPLTANDPILLLLDLYYNLDYDSLNKATVNMLKGMALIQLPISHIAKLFNISIFRLSLMTINGERYDLMHKRISMLGKTILYRKQWLLALKGNVTLLIWLGKQVLGQSDTPMFVDENEILEGLEVVEQDKDLKQ